MLRPGTATASETEEALQGSTATCGKDLELTRSSQAAEGEGGVVADRPADGHKSVRVTAVILDPYSLWLDIVKRLTERAGIKVVATTTSPQLAKEALTARKPNVFILGLERRSIQP